MALNRHSTIAVGIVLSLTVVAGCNRGVEAARAMIAERQASWARQLGGIKEQHAILAARLGVQSVRSRRGEPAIDNESARAGGYLQARQLRRAPVEVAVTSRGGTK